MTIRLVPVSVRLVPVSVRLGGYRCAWCRYRCAWCRYRCAWAGIGVSGESSVGIGVLGPVTVCLVPVSVSLGRHRCFCCRYRCDAVGRHKQTIPGRDRVPDISVPLQRATWQQPGRRRAGHFRRAGQLA